MTTFNIAAASRSVYLPASQVRAIFNLFLETKEPAYRETVTTAMKDCGNTRKKILAWVKESIVITTIRNAIANKNEVDTYVEGLIKGETDEVVRNFKRDIFNHVSDTVLHPQ